MAIAFGGYAVVVKHTSLERLFPGGVAAYSAQAPNGTYASDGNICAVSFMIIDDATAWTKHLVAFGLSDPLNTPSPDIAIVDQTARRLTQNDWLKVGCRAVADASGQTTEVPLAWTVDETAVSFTPPPGWQPPTLDMMDFRDFQENYEEVVDHEQRAGSGRVIAYRDRRNGRIRYVGRPAVHVSEEHRKYQELAHRLTRLLAMPISKPRDDELPSFLNEAASLVKASDNKAWQPLFAQGVAARLLRKWTLAAESFRKVTVLNPSLLDGWLELTWALATLDRVDEAEISARRAVEINPKSAPALGNLSSVLLQLGRREEALQVITHAVELDPTDTKNQLILSRLRTRPPDIDRLPEKPDRPWYKRWTRP